MGNWKIENLPNRPATLYVVYQVADSDLELKGGARFDLLTPLAFLPSVRFFIFLTQNKEGRSPPGPSPRSATGILLHSCLSSFH